MRRIGDSHAHLVVCALLAVAGAGCRSAEAAREHERAGAAHLQAGRTVEGAAELEAALDEDPGSVQAATSLAAIYERSGDPTRALRILSEAVRERPSVHLARMSLAGLLTRLGRLEEALAHYAVVGQQAQHASAFLGMADIYEARGEVPAAERAIIAALQAETTNPAPRRRLARLYDGVGRVEARVAWERYLAAALGNPDERPGIDEASARLRLLAPALSRDEQAAILVTVRRHLATIPLGPSGNLSPDEAAAVASDAGPAPLRRFYSGRMHLCLRAPGAPPVRGAGSGATLYEGAMAAAEDLRRSRVYDVYYAGALGRARAEVHLEVGDPAPFAPIEAASAGEVVPDEGGPFAEDELLEWRLGGRAVAVLPTDRAANGLATLRASLAWAATEAGLGGEEWRKGTAKRVRVRGFIEDDAGGTSLSGGLGLASAPTPLGDASRAGESESGLERGAGIGRAAPVDLSGGLPAPPPADRARALAAARAGAVWIIGGLNSEGALPSGYDPRTGALATPTARAQAAAVEALLEASQAVGEARLHDGALLARRWLAQEVFRAGGGTETSTSPPITTGAAALAAEIEKAIADLDAASATSAASPTAAAAPSTRTTASGAKPGPASKTAPAEAAADRRLRELVREALRLSIAPCASALYQDRGRVLGAFREGRLDPRITLEGTARLVAALCRAAPRLPLEGASRS